MRRLISVQPLLLIYVFMSFSFLKPAVSGEIVDQIKDNTEDLVMSKNNEKEKSILDRVIDIVRGKRKEAYTE
ncbi:MAG: hypothetical protein F6K58_01765 [Symploca sp. SIO2E9]|nr:hypothetical protein [Symploca sp. SIO2E9]